MMSLVLVGGGYNTVNKYKKGGEEKNRQNIVNHPSYQ